MRQDSQQPTQYGRPLGAVRKLSSLVTDASPQLLHVAVCCNEHAPGTAVDAHITNTNSAILQSMKYVPQGRLVAPKTQAGAVLYAHLVEECRYLAAQDLWRIVHAASYDVLRLWQLPLAA